MEVEVYDDLTCIKLTRSLNKIKMHVYLYIFDGVLIDSGPNYLKEITLPYLEKQSFTDVIFTHSHEDHVGIGYELQQMGKQLWIHETGLGEITKKSKLPLYRRVFWRKREAFSAKPLANIFESKHYQWEVIHTPGHSDDHVSLYLRDKKWMFTGDLFVQTHPKSFYKFESFYEQVDSLKKMLSYDIDLIICQHSGIHQSKHLLERKLHYLTQLERDVTNLFTEGKSIKEIRKELFPRKHVLERISFGESSPEHFIKEIIKKTSENNPNNR